MTNDNTAEQLRASSLETVVAFLLGEAELDGVWFGDKNTRRKGAFWWREYLREAFEFGPIAWESTTPVYFKYVNQAKYEKFSPAVRQWYKPYRCTDCANTRADSGEAVAWRWRDDVRPGLPWRTTTDADVITELRAKGGYEIEQLFTHPRATAVDADCQLLPKGWRIEVRDNGRTKGLCVFSPDDCFAVDGNTDHKSDIRQHVIDLLDAALSQRGEKGNATEVGL